LSVEGSSLTSPDCRSRSCGKHFGIKNGATSLQELRARLERFKRVGISREDYSIGCILLEQPFFLPQQNWVAAPVDWHPNIVQGRKYDLASGIGLRLWAARRPPRERATA
jgi:putative restriction endonuclease